MPIKAVLFDMFDTLILNEKNREYYWPSLRRMHRFLNEHRIFVTFDEFTVAYFKVHDQLYPKPNLNFEEPHFSLRVKNVLLELGYRAEVEENSLIQGATDAFCKEFMNHLGIDENAAAVLKQLHKKYYLGIVSNSPIPECVDKILEYNHLKELFDVVVVSGAVNKRKPSPEIFKITLEALGVSASETVFVGDTVEDDVEGPKAVGMRAVYIERRVQEFKKVYPDQTIKSLSELHLVLERF